MTVFGRNSSHSSESSYEYETVSSSSDDSSYAYETASSSLDELSSFELPSLGSCSSSDCSSSSAPLVDETQDKVVDKDNTSSSDEFPTITCNSQHSMISDVSHDDDDEGFSSFVGSDKDLQSEIDALKFIVSKSTFFSEKDINKCLEKLNDVVDEAETTSRSNIIKNNPTKTRQRTHRKEPIRRERCRRASPMRDAPILERLNVVVDETETARSINNTTKTRQQTPSEPIKRERCRRATSPPRDATIVPSMSAPSPIIVPSKDDSVDVEIARTLTLAKKKKKRIVVVEETKTIEPPPPARQEEPSSPKKLPLRKLRRTSLSTNFAGEVIENFEDDHDDLPSSPPSSLRRRPSLLSSSSRKSLSSSIRSSFQKSPEALLSPLRRRRPSLLSSSRHSLSSSIKFQLAKAVVLTPPNKFSSSSRAPKEEKEGVTSTTLVMKPQRRSVWSSMVTTRTSRLFKSSRQS